MCRVSRWLSPCSVGSVLAATHTLEGKFGRAVIDAERPSVTTLVLRRADGSLEPQSLLSPKERPLAPRDA